MGRTRPKSRKAHPAPAAPANTAENASPSVPALLEKAQSLIVQCDYELAGRFVKRILQRESTNAVAKEMLGVIQLEIGELLDAKKVRLLSCLTIAVLIVGILDFPYPGFPSPGRT